MSDVETFRVLKEIVEDSSPWDERGAPGFDCQVCGARKGHTASCAWEEAERLMAGETVERTAHELLFRIVQNMSPWDEVEHGWDGPERVCRVCWERYSHGNDCAWERAEDLVYGRGDS